MGDKVGRVHIQQPNLNNLYIKKNKKLLKMRRDEKEGKSNAGGEEAVQADTEVQKKLKV